MNEISNQDSWNQKLQRLALEAQNHAPLSPERQRILQKLIYLIWTSGELAYPQRQTYPAWLYQEIYPEAVQKTFEYICQKIDKYRPEHPVIAWVNNLLNWKIKEARKEWRGGGVTKMPKRETAQVVPITNFLTYESIQSTPENSFDWGSLQDFLKDDPQHLLKGIKLKGYPHITLHFLAHARVIEKQTWKEISQQTEVKISTLSSFFQRNLRKILPDIRKSLQG